MSFDYEHTNGGDRLWNRPFSQLSGLRDLDLGSGHMAYRGASHIDLNPQNKAEVEKLFMNTQMYTRMDSETNFIQAT